MLIIKSNFIFYKKHVLRKQITQIPGLSQTSSSTTKTTRRRRNCADLSTCSTNKSFLFSRFEYCNECIQIVRLWSLEQRSPVISSTSWPWCPRVITSLGKVSFWQDVHVITSSNVLLFPILKFIIVLFKSLSNEIICRSNTD